MLTYGRLTVELKTLLEPGPYSYTMCRSCSFAIILLLRCCNTKQSDTQRVHRELKRKQLRPFALFRCLHVYTYTVCLPLPIMLILLSRESDKTLRLERVESKLVVFVLRVFIHLLLVRNSPNRDIIYRRNNKNCLRIDPQTVWSCCCINDASTHCVTLLATRLLTCGGKEQCFSNSGCLFWQWA